MFTKSQRKRRLALLSVLMALAITICVVVILLGYLNTSDSITTTGISENPQQIPTLTGTSGETGLAWANQKVVLENDWHEDDGSCLWGEPGSSFEVQYFIVDGPGELISGFGSEIGEYTPEYGLAVEVLVDDSNTIVNANCTSRVIFESAEEGEILVSAWTSLQDADSIRQDIVHFDIYYLKFETSTLDSPVSDIPVSGEIIIFDDDLE